MRIRLLPFILFCIGFSILLIGEGFLLFQSFHISSEENDLPTRSPVATPSVSSASADFSLAARSVRLQNGQVPDFYVLNGYEITPAAEGMKRIRFMAQSPDGRLFLTDMYDLSDNSKGSVYILDDWNEQTKKFGTRHVYLTNLRNPNSIAFYRDQQGVDWLYLALTDKLVRYRYAARETEPTSAPKTIATFPDYGLSYKYGGWHLTRTVASHGDKIYVSVGSSCNACEERSDEWQRASILQMNPDGTGQKVYASGLRNAVGIKWVGETLFATEMGSDHLGNDKPADKLYEIKEGVHYGWPYCYESLGHVFEDTTIAWKQKNVDCEDVPRSYAAFDAHSAPLGLEYFNKEGTDERLKDAFLVGLHGSGVVSIGNGYRIVRVNSKGFVQEVVAGFLKNETRIGRPVDILQNDANSFFFTDDFAGVLYYVGRSQ